MRKISNTMLFSTFGDNPEVKKALNQEFNGSLDALSPMIVTELTESVLRRESSPFAHAAKESLKDGSIRFVYKPPYNALPAFMPITLKIDSSTGKPAAIIMLQNYYSDRDADAKTVPKLKPNQITGLLYGAEALKAIALKPTSFIRNESFVKGLASSYAKMLHRILDKEYGVGTELETTMIVKLAILKFFMMYVLELSDHDRIMRMCLDTLPHPFKGQRVLWSKLSSFEKDFSNPYESLTEVVNLLKAITPRFEKLNVRMLFVAVNAMYGETALLALENAGYFVLQFIFTFTKSNLNNGYSFEDVFKQDTKVLEMALVKQLSA